jgi:flagellar biosynthesis/type III secretory pathway chaperone
MELLDKFINLLNEEIRLYDSLLSIFQQEKKAVVESNLTALNESTKAKENVFLKIRILEEQRTAFLERMSNSLEQPARSLTLTALSRLLEDPYASRIRDCQSRFLSLAQSIQEINANNKALLHHSLNLVRSSLNLLNDLIPANPIYYPSGKMHTNDQIGRVLSGKV